MVRKRRKLKKELFILFWSTFFLSFFFFFFFFSFNLVRSKLTTGTGNDQGKMSVSRESLEMLATSIPAA